jgi:hypothetical protein
MFVEILHFTLGIGCPMLEEKIFNACQNMMLDPSSYRLIAETSPFHIKDIVKNQCILELNTRQRKA